MKPYVGVIGGARVEEQIYGLAEKVGEIIAKNRCILVCGGLSGVMEAAAKGAHNAGGMTIGILPQPDKTSANDYIHIAIATNMGHARNVIIAHTADLLVAIDGGEGTLSEIAVGLILKKPVYGFSTWDVKGVHQLKSIQELDRILQKWVNDTITSAQ